MKHNLRMAFLSLLLVLTLGVMPAFAESADHAMDWTHGIGSRYRTDVTSALPFEDELFFISGSQLLRVDDPEYEPEVVCNLEDIIRESARLLVPGGRFYMVHRPFRLAEIISLMVQYRIEPKRMRLVYPYVDREPNMVLIEGLRGGKSRMTVEKPLIVYKEPGKYTDEIYDVYGYWL